MNLHVASSSSWEGVSAIRKGALFSLGAVTFAIPWENMVMLPSIGTISRVLGLLALIMTVLTVFIEKKARPLTAMHGVIFLYVWWSAMSFFWSNNIDAAVIYLTTLMQISVFVWLLWELAATGGDKVFLLKAYVLGAYVSAFATLKAFATGQESNYLRYAASGFDPNDLGLILALGMPMAWYAALTSNKRLQTALFGLYLPVAAVAVALTSSRGSTVAFVVASLFILWSLSALSLGARVTVLLLLLVTGAGLLYFVPLSSWERIGTLPTEIAHGTLNARLTIWDSGFDIFTENPLLGVGPGNFNESIDVYLGNKVSPHNTFLGVLVEQGSIGFLILLLILSFSFFLTRRMPALDRKLWIVLLLTWAAGAMSLTWMVRKPTWFILGLLACYGSSGFPSPGKDRAERRTPASACARQIPGSAGDSL